MMDSHKAKPSSQMKLTGLLGPPSNAPRLPNQPVMNVLGQVLNTQPMPAPSTIPVRSITAPEGPLFYRPMMEPPKNVYAPTQVTSPPMEHRSLIPSFSYHSNYSQASFDPSNGSCLIGPIMNSDFQSPFVMGQNNISKIIDTNGQGARSSFLSTQSNSMQSHFSPHQGSIPNLGIMNSPPQLLSSTILSSVQNTPQVNKKKPDDVDQLLGSLRILVQQGKISPDQISKIVAEGTNGQQQMPSSVPIYSQSTQAQNSAFTAMAQAEGFDYQNRVYLSPASGSGPYTDTSSPPQNEMVLDYHNESTYPYYPGDLSAYYSGNYSDMYQDISQFFCGLSLDHGISFDQSLFSGVKKLTPEERKMSILKYKNKIKKYRISNPITRRFTGRSTVAGKKRRIKGKFVTEEEYIKYLMKVQKRSGNNSRHSDANNSRHSDADPAAKGQEKQDVKEENK